MGQPKRQGKVSTEIQGDYVYELSQFWNPQWNFLCCILSERMQVPDVVFERGKMAKKTSEPVYF